MKPPIVLPPGQNLRLAVVEDYRHARQAYDERAEREAGSAEHLPTEWREWRAANPGPTLKQWWIDHAQQLPIGEEPVSMRHPKFDFRCPAYLWRTARRIAQRRGDSLSEVLRAALINYVRLLGTPEDREPDNRGVGA